MPRCRLAIAIPTFERSGAIAVNLPQLLSDAAGLDVHIYVSDDSRDDATEQIVCKLIETHDNLHYRRNTPSYGHDRNVVATTTWPDADYVWLLGDVFRFLAGGLARIIEFLDDQDLVFVNWQDEDISLRPRVTGGDARAILKERLWHQAMTGATVYSSRVAEWIKENYRTYHRNFPQIGIMLGFAAARPLTIGWFGIKILQAETKASSYWRHRALDVFVNDWGAAVANFPEVIPREDLARVIRSHSAKTQLFYGDFLYRLRESGQFSWRSLRRPFFWQAMHISPFKVLMLVLLPKPLARRLLKLAAKPWKADP